MFNLDFYKNRKVLITGNTGFKGSWMVKILSKAGAVVTGYSLKPPTHPSLFELANLELGIKSIIGDINDFDNLYRVFKETQPEIVFHLAAQPIVAEGYINPHYTYQTNLMGTLNVLECIRLSTSVKSFINVTTDKVYQNKEWQWSYREIDNINGYDPYSNSKSCSEYITETYNNCYLIQKSISVSTARAGNVIGGGDFAVDRIIPDCVRSAVEHKELIIRNENSVRPYQHVLEPLFAYLLLAMKQYDEIKYSGSYNIGPNEEDSATTGKIVKIFIDKWGKDIKINYKNTQKFHETSYLKLNTSKFKNSFDWNPKWNIDVAIEKTVEWTKAWLDNQDISKVMSDQIDEYIGK